MHPRRLVSSQTCKDWKVLLLHCVTHGHTSAVGDGMTVDSLMALHV